MYLAKSLPSIKSLDSLIEQFVAPKSLSTESNLRGSNFQKFPGGIPPDPLRWHALHASVLRTLRSYQAISVI